MRVRTIALALPLLLAASCDAPERDAARNSAETAGDPSDIDKAEGDGDDDGYDDGYDDGDDDDGGDDDGDDECTRTQGYWKNHPAAWPEDAVDATLCDVDWMTWLHTPTAAGEYGEHWTLLAHQYIAAKLNYLSGANPSDEVADALDAANALLTACAPAPDADEASDLATTLDEFNNGAEGTSDCDGDGTGGDDGEPSDDDGEPGDDDGEPGDDDGEPGDDDGEPSDDGGGGEGGDGSVPQP